jgi:hypothetical protein
MSGLKFITVEGERKDTIWKDSYLLTYGAEPFLRSANCEATQELPTILWNLKVHYHVHKSPQYGRMNGKKNGRILKSFPEYPFQLLMKKN